jgi:diadenylate cyclase
LVAILSPAQVDLLDQFGFLYDRIADRPWITLIELLLIGSVVYATLRLLQGTPGARLVRAVLLILGVSFAVVWLVAERFGFERINVLYPYFILAVFLASLVAFQAELRRILAKVSEANLLRRWLQNPETSLAPILAAAGRLSKRKIGALIAIERSTEMGPFSESGVPLDALASAELIETIFWPGSPLHDLGLIIRQGRLVAAGCQFPLAESGAVDRSLGSRHRAAVGMSLETDAIVIVVSEETGQISVAAGGHLKRGLSLDELRTTLSSELASPTRPRASDDQTSVTVSVSSSSVSSIRQVRET